MESEAFLLFVILLTPFVWVLQGDMLVRNVSVALRSLVVVGFFAGRLLRGRAGIWHLFRPAMSRASLLFLCAAVAFDDLGERGANLRVRASLIPDGHICGFLFCGPGLGGFTAAVS